MLHLWLIPALPLAGFLLNGLLGRRASKTFVNLIAIGSVLLSFLWVLKTLLALGSMEQTHLEQYFTWIQSGAINIGCDFLVDRLKNAAYPDEEDIEEARWLRTYIGKTGFVQLGWPYQGTVFLFESSTEWYDRYQRLLDVAEEYGGIMIDEPDDKDEER